MKTNNYIILGLLALGFMACEMRDELKKLPSKEDQQEEGWFTLDVVSNGQNQTTKAAFDSKDVDATLYPVEIINMISGTTEHHYDSYADLLTQGQVKLVTGKYKVVAYNYDGSNVNASERPWFRGETEFEILAGKTTKVNTICKLQNIAVTVGFTDNFKKQFQDDYAITVTNGEAGVKVFEKEQLGKTFFFKVPEKKNSVQLTVKATTTANTQIAQNYTVTKPADAEGNSNLVSGDEFTVNIDAGNEPSVDPTTQIELNISVDLTMNETGLTIEIPTENIVFNGDGGSTPDPDVPDPDDPGKDQITVTGLGETYNLPLSEGQKVLVNISAPKGITKLLVKIDSDNEEFMATLGGFGLAEEFDIANPGKLFDVLSNSLESGNGIGLIDPDDPIKGKTSYLFDVTDFMVLLVNVGAVTRNQQEAGRVVAARCADNIHKRLVDFVRQRIPLIVVQVGNDGIGAVQRGIFIEAAAELLVCALENQVIGVITETFGNLLPHALVGFHGQCAGFGAFRTEHAIPAAIPMVIDDDVHARLARIADNFLHAVHVVGVDGVVAFVEVGGVGHPSHGNADGVKARRLHAVNHGLRRFRLTPVRLIAKGRVRLDADVVVAGFQGVAEVDAVAHQAGSLQRRQALAHHAVIHRFRLFRRPYAGNQHQHRQHQAEQVQEPLLHIHRSFLLRI